MQDSSPSLEQQIQELTPAQQARVREYVEHLLAQSKAGDPVPETTDPGADAVISLREITGETVHSISRLSDTLTPPKKYMVATNAMSIAEAHFEQKAWFRAIYADDTPVGFVMLYDDAVEPTYFLWRFMIAEPHHNKGFGRRALQLLIDYVKTRPGATVLETSCGQGPGNPEGFYRKIGFERSGKMYDDEVGLIMSLA